MQLKILVPFFILTSALLSAQDAPAKCEGLPPGKHVQLERMAAAMGLTCPQQHRIEVLLHDEESVTKPLLKFTSLSAEERAGVMTKIKVVARRQIKTELTPAQQNWMDEDIASVSRGGKKGSGKKAAPAAEPSADPLAGQDALCKAIMAYSALTPDEKAALAKTVKQAALNDSNLQFTPGQKKQLEAELKALSKAAR